ncbi:MAG TPA: hypothetical protein VKA74_07625 [Myxococcota bacterium]|nr:hypothetical protein [Myxococcota bacterium]
MRRIAFSLGLLMACLLAAVGLGFGVDRPLERLGVEGPADAVLVFVIPDPASARRVRGAIPGDRILWQGAIGLALQGGRVIASTLDDAGDVIEQAGWVARPIRIVRLEARSDAGGDLGRGGDHGGGLDREARLARLRELVHAPRLTRAEQVFVLRAMNDGIEL